MPKNFFDGWKKFSTNGKNTVMAHPGGHKMIIQHKRLSKEHLKQLHELEFATADNAKKPTMMANGGKVADSKNSKAILKENNKAQEELIDETQSPELKRMLEMEPRRKMAEGGVATTPEELLTPEVAQAAANAAAPIADAAMASPVEAPATPQYTPDQLELHKIYNSMAMPPGPQGGAKAGAPDADNSADKMFGPNGEPPKAVDTGLLTQAVEKRAELQTSRAEEEKAKAEEEKAKAEEEAKKSAAMVAAGLAPPAPLAPQAPTPQGQIAPQQQPPQTDLTDPTPIMAKGIQAQKSGMMQEARALENQGNAEAKVLENQIPLQQEALTHYKTHIQDLENERQSLIRDINNQHINPKQFIGNMDTVSRVSTAIGLIMSGFGSGVTGQTNMAQKFLDDQISRDIDAQKANLGKSTSLLSANLQQFGNMKDAAEMTRVMLNDVTANQLKLEAAKAQGPLAKARLLQHAGALDERSAPVLAQLAGRQTLNTLMKSVGNDDRRMAEVIRVAQNVDPAMAKDLQGRYVPGMGFANTDGDAKTMKEVKSSAEVINKGITDLLTINKQPGKSFSTELRTKAESIAASLLAPMRTANGLGTLSEGDKKLLEGIIRNPTNIFSLDSSNRIALETVIRNTNRNVFEKAKISGINMPDPDSIKHLPVK